MVEEFRDVLIGLGHRTVMAVVGFLIGLVVALAVLAVRCALAVGAAFGMWWFSQNLVMPSLLHDPQFIGPHPALATIELFTLCGYIASGMVSLGAASVGWQLFPLPADDDDDTNDLPPRHRLRRRRAVPAS